MVGIKVSIFKGYDLRNIFSFMRGKRFCILVVYGGNIWKILTRFMEIVDIVWIHPTAMIKHFKPRVDKIA